MRSTTGTSAFNCCMRYGVLIDGYIGNLKSNLVNCYVRCLATGERVSKTLLLLEIIFIRERTSVYNWSNDEISAIIDYLCREWYICLYCLYAYFSREWYISLYYIYAYQCREWYVYLYCLYAYLCREWYICLFRLYIFISVESDISVKYCLYVYLFLEWYICLYYFYAFSV